ncbi:MAG TPA: DUF1015 domain-containing protein [Ktedonobacteraceae bacterium]|jgi:uncharacterized protein (DUF1015 family)|nr:DUF1015 domain-containing protein [Ktedonobacteraceae bacterium]
MADVQPLRGIRYAGEIVGDLGQIVTPPYDVISEGAQASYYERSPYNVIRLELSRDEPGDDSLNNRYTRAAETLAEWRLRGVLRQDSLPAYYLYQQKFTQNGQSYTRTSLLARVRLEPWSARVVLPHEHTLSKPKLDRLQLMRATAMNLSPLMSLYDDPQARIRKLLSSYGANPEVKITDEVGEKHVLYAITDRQQIALIQDFFAERQLYIADGHHRYETALNYREEVLEQRRRLRADDAVNFVLMALIDIDDPGLVVLPTHRLVFDLSQDALDALTAERLAGYFTVRALGQAGETNAGALLRELAGAGKLAPSLVVQTVDHTWLLSLNEWGRARMAQSGHSHAWNELDVAVAHTLLLEDLLGLRAEDVTAGAHIRYTRDAQQALEALGKREAQLALLLNPTRVRQVCEVADAGDKMPQKSTYFYPKLITGLVMNPLW